MSLWPERPWFSSIDRPTFSTDNEVGVSAGVRHLVDRGHLRIGYLGDLQTIPIDALRNGGYAEELIAHQLSVDRRLVRLDIRGIDSAEAAATELLSLAEPPTALFASQNLLTIGVHRALRKLGLHRTVALVGFDDFRLADLLEPGITVIAQDLPRSGKPPPKSLFDGSTASKARPSARFSLRI